MIFLMVLVAFASERTKSDTADLILVNIEEGHTEAHDNTSQYIGVHLSREEVAVARWHAYRRSKNDKTMIYNGTYKSEEAAARASDSLAKRLMENGEVNHKLNFAEDSEVKADLMIKSSEKKSSEYVGVAYLKKKSTWCVSRWSKKEKKTMYNGRFEDEETAARVSDILARKLIANGEHGHKLNFPENDSEVYQEGVLLKKASKYYGVCFCQDKWQAKRWSKDEKKMVTNGIYKNEKTAAYWSDILAKSLMKNGEKDHKLNFPDDTERQTNKRKRSKIEDLEHSQNNVCSKSIKATVQYGVQNNFIQT